MGLLSSLHYYYVTLLDERVASWVMVDNAYAVVLLVAAYVSFIFYIGPQYMKNRPPYSLKKFIQCFDIFQIVMNSYIVYLLLDSGWYQEVWIYCQKAVYSTEPGPMKVATAVWWAMTLKFLDFIETGIYVLRKKNNQISGLHVYHHISTAIISWLGMRYIAVGMASTIPLMNCAIHVIMYTYYFLSTLGPNVVKVILPYKPLLTILQMVQFVLMIIYIVQTLMPSCPVTKVPGPIMIVNLIINFFLFYDFYKKSYKSPKTKSK